MSVWTVPSWADVKAGWSGGWKALSEQATRACASAVQVDPTGTLQKVQAFLAAQADSRAALDRIAAKLPNPPVTEADRVAVANYRAMEVRWHDLAAGFYADATPAPAGGAGAPPGTPVVGVAPAVLIVAGVAVGVVGVAWAIAAYEYAVNLREQTSLAERELDARVAANAQGRTLQPTTLPPQQGPVDAAKDAAKGVGVLLVGGLVVTAGALLLPSLLKR